MKTWLLIIMACTAPLASAEMWKCEDQDGKTRYTNVKADAKGCKSLNLDPINTTPAPKAPQPSQSKSVNFPSVDNDTQRQRDAGRRKILDQELALEQQQYEVARRALAEQQEIRLGSEKNPVRMQERLKPFEDRVKLHENNIESLRKEIANVR